jgi:hypothetical protein
MHGRAPAMGSTLLFPTRPARRSAPATFPARERDDDGKGGRGLKCVFFQIVSASMRRNMQETEIQVPGI